MARLVAEIESSELGRESEELLDPLRLLADSLVDAGLLDDAYNVMMRAMVLCEKHHGEEGMATCQTRTIMGEALCACCPYEVFKILISICIRPSPPPSSSLECNFLRRSLCINGK